MKKTLLVAVNARFSHTNLAVRSLKLALDAAGIPAAFVEYTINQPVREILADIVSRAPGCSFPVISGTSDRSSSLVRNFALSSRTFQSCWADRRSASTRRTGSPVTDGRTASSAARGSRSSRRYCQNRIRAGFSAPAGLPTWTRSRSHTATLHPSPTGYSIMNHRAAVRTAAPTASPPPTGRCGSARCRSSLTICKNCSTHG